MASLGGSALLAVLFTATLLATASALSKPPRRLMGTDTGIGGWNFKGNYADVCYDKPHALIETWAIRFMCDEVKQGKTETWLMELEDPKCVSKDEIKVVIINGEPVITGNVCKTVKHKVAVDQNQCDVLLNPQNTACRGYLSERTPPNIGNTWALLTVHEIPVPSLAPTVRFQVDLEAMCGSLQDPVFKAWLAVGTVYQGEDCTGAKYNGDDTLPPVPFFPEGKSYATTTVVPTPRPTPVPARK